MWSDPIVWIPLLGVAIMAILTFIYHCIGNKEFRNNVGRAITWLKVKVIKERFFFSVYIPLLILLLIILHFVSLLTLTTFFISYAAWITIWAIHLKKRRKNVSTVVSCRLGNEASERGDNGLIYIRHEDGDAAKEVFRGESIRRTDAANFQYYIYFAFRKDLVKYFRSANSIVILVEFFDFETDEYKGHSFNIHYDSRDRSHANPIFKSSSIVSFTESNSWQLGLFKIKDGRFKRRQQNKADFRVLCKLGSVQDSKDLYVRSVITVALNE